MPLSPWVHLTLISLRFSHLLEINFFPAKVHHSQQCREKGENSPSRVGPSWADTTPYFTLSWKTTAIALSHKMPTHFLHSSEKLKGVEHHQKEIALQKRPGAHATKVSKPAVSAGAVGWSISLLAAGPSLGSLREEREGHLHGEQVRFP